VVALARGFAVAGVACGNGASFGFGNVVGFGNAVGFVGSYRAVIVARPVRIVGPVVEIIEIIEIIVEVVVGLAVGEGLREVGVGGEEAGDEVGGDDEVGGGNRSPRSFVAVSEVEAAEFHHRVGRTLASVARAASGVRGVGRAGEIVEGFADHPRSGLVDEAIDGKHPEDGGGETQVARLVSVLGVSLADKVVGGMTPVGDRPVVVGRVGKGVGEFKEQVELLVEH